MKIVKNIFLGLCVAFFIWGLASYVDIVADNSWENPVHSEYNLFVLMTK